MANAISEVSLTRNFKRKIDRNTRSRNMANAICEAIKSFCLRDRADLEMKVGRFRFKVMRKVVSFRFRFNDPVLAEVWISDPHGSPEADFSVLLVACNVQLSSDKTKTIFVMPYSEMFIGENISLREFFVRLWLLSQLGPF